MIKITIIIEDTDIAYNSGNYIGKNYYPNDNSYSMDISNGEHGYLVQDCAYCPIEKGANFICISNPYRKTIKTVIGDYKEYTFINVLSTKTKKTYRVLFSESNVE